MRIAFLTTETAHHTYYAWKVAERFPLSAVVVETAVLAAPFETFHPFETKRDEHEREVLLGAVGGTLADVAQVHTVENVNEALPTLQATSPDVVLVFGTGLLLPETIAAAPTCLNLHGGDPEEYRGLDTHLWAVYHGDFGALVTTLHHVSEELDVGDIAYREPVPLRRDMPLHELRARNTDVCVDLTLRALDELAASGSAPRRRQSRRGRYYSFMPAVLKERCVMQFARHTASL